MKIVQSIIAGTAGLFSLVYLFNPTAGVDFIPDFLPIVGNLDEAAAATILIAALAYFGLDVTRLFGRASVVDAANAYGKKDKDGEIIEAETVQERVDR